MPIRWLSALMVVGTLFNGALTRANVITYSLDWPPRKVTAAETAGGAPADGRVFRFRVTTDGDILSVNTLRLNPTPSALLYNHPFGEPGESNPPNPLLVDLFPAVGADSWIDTPGVTSLLGSPLPGDGVNTTYGDLSNDGPQHDFVFAQLTLSPEEQISFNFTGFVSIAGNGGLTVYSQPFSIPVFGPFPDVPEPSSVALLTACIFAVSLMRRRR